MAAQQQAGPALLDIGEIAELLQGEESDAARDIVGAVLASVREFLGMEVAFVGEFAHGARLFRFVDAGFDNCPVHTGGSDPLEETYCARVVDGRLPELITDAAAVPEAAAMPVTRDFPVGAHLSVPIVFSTGRVYGTFCAFSRSPDPGLRERDLGVMRMLAQLLGGYLERSELANGDRARSARRIIEVMREGRLETALQPIVALSTGQVVGYEALSRFPQGRPDEWFTEAARVGLGVQLELAAFERAWSYRPLLPRDAYLAVNLSPAAVCSAELAARIDAEPPDGLVVELTEHTTVTDYELVMERVAWLRSRGALVAVDDAGSGYAGLHRILTLAPDILKLDLQLTRGVARDPARQALVRALTWYATSTASTVVAEGIEMQEDLDVLRSLGVPFGQGYHLGRPALAAEVVGGLVGGLVGEVDEVADLLTTPGRISTL